MRLGTSDFLDWSIGGDYIFENGTNGTCGTNGRSETRDLVSEPVGVFPWGDGNTGLESPVNPQTERRPRNESLRCA